VSDQYYIQGNKKPSNHPTQFIGHKRVSTFTQVICTLSIIINRIMNLFIVYKNKIILIFLNNKNDVFPSFDAYMPLNCLYDTPC